MGHDRYNGGSYCSPENKIKSLHAQSLIKGQTSCATLLLRSCYEARLNKSWVVWEEYIALCMKKNLGHNMKTSSQWLSIVERASWSSFWRTPREEAPVIHPCSLSNANIILNSYFVPFQIWLSNTLPLYSAMVASAEQSTLHFLIW